MADKSLIEQMLERLVNEDQTKAEELFHEYVVAPDAEIEVDCPEQIVVVPVAVTVGADGSTSACVTTFELHPPAVNPIE